MSGKDSGNEYDLSAIMDATGAATSGISHGALMNALAEGVCRRDLRQLHEARRAIIEQMGVRAMVDAVAVIAAFNGYPRVADATGLPLEDEKRQRTEGLRAELGLDALDDP